MIARRTYSARRPPLRAASSLLLPSLIPRFLFSFEQLFGQEEKDVYGRGAGLGVYYTGGDIRFAVFLCWQLLLSLCFP